MKKISIILLFLTAVCPLAQAQRVKVYVTDAWDKPLGEVAVTLGRGRTPVAVTGADGMAEVDAGEGDRMTLTLLNRMSRTVAVSGGEMHIRLTDDDVLFDVGYDERIRKGSASASLAGATAREIEAGGRTDLMSNLYGLIPGLGVRQGENLPWDSAPDLNVRGVGSFGGNSVVVLVDGIERDAACLDREEVEHITVLKDAASLALYGNRGADGIVAITTRRGGDHGLRTRIDYNFSVQTRSGFPIWPMPRPMRRLSTRRWKTTGSHPAIRSATSVRWCGGAHRCTAQCRLAEGRAPQCGFQPRPESLVRRERRQYALFRAGQLQLQPRVPG